ncbi:caspase family protein [Flagellimonas alvinocaridis]|uniref:Caspase family protein n=1 Tax=Flagellimonas alvinocaridis TaxID=2530200 RepID=A0A4S8REX7_9FLAO|nr:caspase family protein [Allomuricauda alvinocaridis]THV56798.1 caspase family protein [Allomuricauda alvinocaridis]
MNKKALVIGINNYSHAPGLDNCISDAMDMHKFLGSNGFECKTVLDPSQSELIKEIADFKRTITEETVSVIYFSGHGLQDDKHNYLVASDSEIRQVEDIKYNCIHADDLLIDTSGENLHFLILDACRNNPFGLGKKGISMGLSKMNAPAGTLIAFSTSPNSTSIERKSERNGIYTKHLIESLNIPNIAAELAFKYTRNAVMDDTSKKQIPWEESSLYGKDFSFVVKEIQFPEVEDILVQWVEDKKEIILPQLLQILEEPFFSSMPLGKLQLILTLVQICITKEQQNLTKKTIDEDYILGKMVDEYLPKFYERLLAEDLESEIVDFNILKKINIQNEINYGFNWMEDPDESFPQIIANEIEFDGDIGILSCFLSIKDKEHFLKPLIIIKGQPISYLDNSIMEGEPVEQFLKSYFEIRKPFEEEPPESGLGWIPG